ncbi:MAG: hypothetical protein RR048_01680, partial [Oscillospiraceae bacterium]
MTKKQKQLLIGAILVLPILALCIYRYYTSPENPFPLQKTAIEQTMKSQDLQWSMEEYPPFADGQSIYMLHNEDGKATSTLSSTSIDGKRAMDLFFI